MNTNGTNFQNELFVKESVETTVKYEVAKKVVETGSMALTTGGLFFLQSTPAGGGELLPNEIKTKSDPRKIITPATYGYLAKYFPEYIKARGNEYTLAGNYKDAMISPKNQGEKIDKVIFKDIKNFYYGTKTLDEKISESEGKLYGSLIGSTYGVITATYTIDNLPKVLDSTLKGGNISSISKISYKTENTSLALYDKSKTLPVPVATNGTLAPSLTTNKELSSVPLLTDGAVSQVQNNRVPYKPVLALPVKYPIKSESGVTIYKDYAIGLRGGKYVEAGITKDNKIAYRNNGSYYVVGQGDDGFKNIPATEVTTNYLISESGGRKGSPETRAQINAIIKVAKDEDWIHVAGGEKSEEYLSASNLGNKSTKDSNYIDITLQKNIEGKEVIVRINTVDTYKNGNLTKREAEAAKLINLKIIREGEGNPQLITIPKGQGTGNIEKILKKIEADMEKDTK